MIKRMSRVELDALGESIAELAAHIDAATWRLLEKIRAFDEAGGWSQQGAASCAVWLSWRVGWSGRASRDRVRVAKALPVLPSINEALRVGELSYSKVRAMTTIATPANETMLLHYARHMTGAQLDRLCREYDGVRRNNAERPEDIAARRTMQTHRTDDGMTRIEIVLRVDEAARVMAAIEAIVKERQVASSSAEPRVSASSRRVDAIVELTEASLRGEQVHHAPVELMMSVSHDALADKDNPPRARFDDGTAVGMHTARRLACDAGIVGVHADAHGQPLSIGRKSRMIPTAIARALRHRDGGCCRFPGCANRRFVEGHHIVHWADGGETSLANLITLCSRHHAFVHEHGYRIAMPGGSAEPRFFNERGREIQPVPAAPRTREALPACNDNLAITADRNRPRWDGNTVDYAACVSGIIAAEATS